MKDQIAIVAPAINPANLATAASALRQLVAIVEAADKAVHAAEGAAQKAREAAASARLAVGRQLVEDRKRWPFSGPRAKGWGEHLTSAGVNDRTAREWMALAGYVEKISAPFGSSGAEISTTVTRTTIPPRREVARETRRVIVDHSQDAAGGGDEPAWQEPTYTPDGEDPAPSAKPCKLCGMVLRTASGGAAEIPIVKIEEAGIGASAYDQLKHSPDLVVIPINVSRSPTSKPLQAGQPAYDILRDQLWFGIADWLKKGGALPPDARLEAQLTRAEYGYTNQNELKVEPKSKMKEKLGHSPDEADALALCIYTPPPKPQAEVGRVVLHRR